MENTCFGLLLHYQVIYRTVEFHQIKGEKSQFRLSTGQKNVSIHLHSIIKICSTYFFVFTLAFLSEEVC